MDFVYEAVRKTRAQLKPDIPLIGFAGAPFTVASYLIEGGGSRNFVRTKSLMHHAPAVWDALMKKITDATIAYVNAQAAAGAQVIQFFDSWVGCLSPDDFRRHVFAHLKRLIAGVTKGVPVISFGTQTNGLLSQFRDAGGDVIGVDWRIELDEAWKVLGDVGIQGNMDPVLLFATPAEIRSQARRILGQAGGRPGHIFNLGHGILPETPVDNVLALIETVKEVSS
jgi:uroporphyrinogen decarboxylase